MNEQLQKTRKNAGFTQQDMANATGITKGYYSLIENGERRVSYELAFAIASKLATKPDTIFLDFQSTKSKQEAAR